MFKPLAITLSALMVAAPTAGSSAANDKIDELDKVVCKRMDVTGSLVQKKRICKTQREWNESQAEAREGAEGMIKNTCAGGPGCT